MTLKPLAFTLEEHFTPLMETIFLFAHMLKMIDHGKGGPTIWEHK